jgi:SAM-dependent methyltransferase
MLKHALRALAWAVAALPCWLWAQETGSPEGLKAEQSLPGRYAYVAEDAVNWCQPARGFWVDLGAGQGGLALALVAATGNPVVMVDPDAAALGAALAAGREKGLAEKLAAVVGKAESLPFPDDSVDLVVSRGSIFFWDDPAKGLEEVRRVLRPGGKAYIGGGAGSGYPKWAVDKLTGGRKENLAGEEAEKWQRFVALRRPEQMTAWARAAGLEHYEVLGRGAVEDDPRVGQGVWLLFTKP